MWMSLRTCHPELIVLILCETRLDFVCALTCHISGETGLQLRWGVYFRLWTYWGLVEELLNRRSWRTRQAKVKRHVKIQRERLCIMDVDLFSVWLPFFFWKVGVSHCRLFGWTEVEYQTVGVHIEECEKHWFMWRTRPRREARPDLLRPGDEGLDEYEEILVQCYLSGRAWYLWIFALRVANTFVEGLDELKYSYNLRISLGMALYE
jgi:hypothetical protein